MSLKKIYRDICLGYTESTFEDKKVFIKHFSDLDLTEIEIAYNKIVEESRAKGIKNRREKLDWLISKGLWNKQKDIDITQQQEFVDNLITTNEKLVFKSQKLQNEKLLAEESVKLNKMIYERESLVDLTAEMVADRKIRFQYIFDSFYTDSNFTNKFFSDKEIWDMDDENSEKLLLFYDKILDDLNIKNIKKISISAFFLNTFAVCTENPQAFFGKPVYLLTISQSNLVSYGGYFRAIFSQNSELPNNIKDDPEKIEEFIKQERNFKDALGKIDPNAASVGIPATKSEFESMGLTRDKSFINSKGPSAEK